MLKEFEWKESPSGRSYVCYISDKEVGSIYRYNNTDEIWACSAIFDQANEDELSFFDAQAWVEQMCRTELESLFVLPSQEENERLRGALRSYADEDAWLDTGRQASGFPIYESFDGGSIARAALDIG